MKKNFICLLCILILGSCADKKSSEGETVDVVLVGGGIMSVTLANMLNELDPDMTMVAYERLDAVGLESSSAWNNAGTGHSALCELNYTPELKDGSIDTHKAVEINESFEISKEFWSYLVGNNKIGPPKTFINPTPHMSFVIGEDNVKYLKKRFLALQKEPLFTGMEFSDDQKQINNWIPLVMNGRDPSQKVAATKIDIGTDVNYGALTNELTSNLVKSGKMKLEVNHEVTNFKRNEDGTWKVYIKDLKNNITKTINAKFVFIGAGGATLPLLEKTHIPEAKGYGGFPVSGEWLVCNNPKIIAQHQAKVYGKASVGSPPMSVPHLDTRVIDGKKELLFGPFAGFSSKFLKNGTWADLPASFNFYNIRPMLEAGLDNVPLTKYLVEQVVLTPEQRLAALQEYFPKAKMEDWDLKIAGQRVQVIKIDNTTQRGILQFGTEVVTASDGSVAALLGASPGASTSVSIMLKVIEKCFKNELKTPKWQEKIKEMIPSYGLKLSDNIPLANKIRKNNSEKLGIVWKEIHTVAPKTETP
ncbi:malate:quinone oxidoreductase [Flavobacterium sp. KMS]|uniref:malate dehydrogenase (quinone) n=1 Tax=Flavobacterium sp. KMS TaxID=1566023 RepID=UPI00057EB188|nr:malate dehydrogenase (quinone) [Flavobacterium sp. KMS]KIA97467.1 malate:quinone oxidoreductase [Flavobacterium sp. KMS]